MIWFGLAALVPALALAAVLVPPARRLALAVNLVAAVRPDRLHREPRPYGGGLAMAATILLVAGGAWAAALALPADRLPGWLPAGVQDHLRARAPVLVRLALGALLFFVIGLLDDRYALKAPLKLLLQTISAAVVVFGFGIRATVWIEAAYVPEAVSILWILAVVNAYNMFDHADGLAAAAALAALVCLAAGQMLMGELFVPGLALVTAGAVAGFFIYNFPPAKLFMGDAGSMLVGYLLAALTIAARYYFPERGTGRAVVLVPLVLLTVPLFDAFGVVICRAARGKNPLVGDAVSHLGHRLLARGVAARRVVLRVLALGVFVGLASVLLYFTRWALAAWVAGVALLAWWNRD